MLFLRPDGASDKYICMQYEKKEERLNKVRQPRQINKKTKEIEEKV